MSKETELFKTKEPKSRSDISRFLHRLADDIGDGQIRLERGQTEIVLELPDTLLFEVEAEGKDKKEKGSEHSVEIELKWYVGGVEDGL
jgi:amphi-Trp domain-containing protein